MPVTKSPLRQPGGKTQLASYVKHLLDINNTHKTYIEPFAGGFGVALELLFDGSVEEVVLNDYDSSIFAIWNSILNNYDDFKNLLINTPLTINEWHRQQQIHLKFKNNPTSVENGFATFYLNRTNRSGIINAGPIGGLNQAGKYKLDCRFNKDSLLKKIENIHNFKEKIHIHNLDANEFIANNLKQYDHHSTFIFYDPPYFKQGQNLYLSFVDRNGHSILANNILKFSNNYKWITTYDLEEDIRYLYSPYVKAYKYSLNYSAGKKRKSEEYLFANNNTLVDSFDKVNLLQIQY